MAGRVWIALAILTGLAAFNVAAVVWFGLSGVGFFAGSTVVLAAVAVLLGLWVLQLYIRNSHQQARAAMESEAELARYADALEGWRKAASHDMHEPLRKIEGFGQRLHDKHGEAIGESGGLYLGRMIDGAQRMRALIEDVQEHALAETAPLKLETIPLDEIARDAAAGIAADIEAAGGTLEIADLPAVPADRALMQVVFRELLANALKYRSPDRAPLIRITSSDPDQAPAGCISIDVIDNGIGFESKHAETIFELLARLHSIGDYPGTGMGLAICRAIVVQRHGGSIKARANPGKDAVFTLTLPVAQGIVS